MAGREEKPATVPAVQRTVEVQVPRGQERQAEEIARFFAAR